MFNFKPVLAATVIALAVPLATTSPSFAQGTKAQILSGGGHGGGGGGGHMGRGGGGGGHMSHGGGGGGHMSRGGGFGGGGRHMGGGGWHGGGYHGGRHYGGGFYPGLITGFGVGSAFASPYYYDDSYGYYDDGPAVEVVPSGGDDIAYCQQRFKSYDVRSGTYLGYDGNRHPCP